MATGCNQEPTEDIDRMLDEAAKGLPELFERNWGEVLEKLDQSLWPVEKEHEEMFKCGRELGMSPVEVISTPEIVGVKGVENIEGQIKDVMTQLSTSKLAPQYREQYTVNKIMFIPEKRMTVRETIELANVFRHEALEEKPEIPRTIHVFLNEKGEFPHGKHLKAVIAHEIFHINALKFEAIVSDHKAEWTKAYKAQKERGEVSAAARLRMDYYAKIAGPDDVRFDEDFMAEHLAAWDIESHNLCREMETFFDKYFTK